MRNREAHQHLHKLFSVRHRLTLLEFRMVLFLGTLSLAGLAIALGNKEPVVWAFLGTSIGISLSQPSK